MRAGKIILLIPLNFVILILAGILIAESLFLDGGGVPKGILAIIGGLGIILAFMAVLNPDMLIMTAGMMIGVSLIIFGTLMLVTAATSLETTELRAARLEVNEGYEFVTEILISSDVPCMPSGPTEVMVKV